MARRRAARSSTGTSMLSSRFSRALKSSRFTGTQTSTVTGTSTTAGPGPRLSSLPKIDTSVPTRADKDRGVLTEEPWRKVTKLMTALVFLDLVIHLLLTVCFAQKVVSSLNRHSYVVLHVFMLLFRAISLHLSVVALIAQMNALWPLEKSTDKKTELNSGEDTSQKSSEEEQQEADSGTKWALCRVAEDPVVAIRRLVGIGFFLTLAVFLLRCGESFVIALDYFTQNDAPFNAQAWFWSFAPSFTAYHESDVFSMLLGGFVTNAGEAVIEIMVLMCLYGYYVAVSQTEGENSTAPAILQILDSEVPVAKISEAPPPLAPIPVGDLKPEPEYKPGKQPQPKLEPRKTPVADLKRAPEYKPGKQLEPKAELQKIPVAGGKRAPEPKPGKELEVKPEPTTTPAPGCKAGMKIQQKREPIKTSLAAPKQAPEPKRGPKLAQGFKPRIGLKQELRRKLRQELRRQAVSKTKPRSVARAATKEPKLPPKPKYYAVGKNKRALQPGLDRQDSTETQHKTGTVYKPDLGWQPEQDAGLKVVAQRVTHVKGTGLEFLPQSKYNAEGKPKPEIESCLEQEEARIFELEPQKQSQPEPTLQPVQQPKPETAPKRGPGQQPVREAGFKAVEQLESQEKISEPALPPKPGYDAEGKPKPALEEPGLEREEVGVPLRQEQLVIVAQPHLTSQSEPPPKPGTEFQPGTEFPPEPRQVPEPEAGLKVVTRQVPQAKGKEPEFVPKPGYVAEGEPEPAQEPGLGRKEGVYSLRTEPGEVAQHQPGEQPYATPKHFVEPSAELAPEQVLKPLTPQERELTQAKTAPMRREALRMPLNFRSRLLSIRGLFRPGGKRTSSSTKKPDSIPIQTEAKPMPAVEISARFGAEHVPSDGKQLVDTPLPETSEKPAVSAARAESFKGPEVSPYAIFGAPSTPATGKAKTDASLPETSPRPTSVERAGVFKMPDMGLVVSSATKKTAAAKLKAAALLRETSMLLNQVVSKTIVSVATKPEPEKGKLPVPAHELEHREPEIEKTALVYKDRAPGGPLGKIQKLCVSGFFKPLQAPSPETSENGEAFSPTGTAEIAAQAPIHGALRDQQALPRQETTFFTGPILKMSGSLRTLPGEPSRGAESVSRAIEEDSTREISPPRMTSSANFGLAQTCPRGPLRGVETFPGTVVDEPVRDISRPRITSSETLGRAPVRGFVPINGIFVPARGLGSLDAAVHDPLEGRISAETPRPTSQRPPWVREVAAKIEDGPQHLRIPRPPLLFKPSQETHCALQQPPQDCSPRQRPFTPYDRRGAPKLPAAAFPTSERAAASRPTASGSVRRPVLPTPSSWSQPGFYEAHEQRSTFNEPTPHRASFTEVVPPDHAKAYLTIGRAAQLRASPITTQSGRPRWPLLPIPTSERPPEGHGAHQERLMEFLYRETSSRASITEESSLPHARARPVSDTVKQLRAATSGADSGPPRRLLLPGPSAEQRQTDECSTSDSSTPRWPEGACGISQERLTELLYRKTPSETSNRGGSSLPHVRARPVSDRVAQLRVATSGADSGLPRRPLLPGPSAEQSQTDECSPSDSSMSGWPAGRCGVLQERLTEFSYRKTPSRMSSRGGSPLPPDRAPPLSGSVAHLSVVTSGVDSGPPRQQLLPGLTAEQTQTVEYSTSDSLDMDEQPMPMPKQDPWLKALQSGIMPPDFAARFPSGPAEGPDEAPRQALPNDASRGSPRGLHEGMARVPARTALELPSSFSLSYPPPPPPPPPLRPRLANVTVGRFFVPIRRTPSRAAAKAEEQETEYSEST